MRKVIIPALVLLTGCAGSDDPPAYGDPYQIAGDPATGDAVSGDPLQGDPAVGDPGAGDPPSPGDSGACHAYGFGGAVVDIVQVGSLPAMSGGTIPLGSYDVVEAKTTGTLTGTIRSTWVFESASVLQILEQITLSGTPPVPTPRTLSWQTTDNQLTRQQVCGGTSSFDNTFSVRTDGSDTYLDVRATSILFTYRLRP